MRREAKVGSVFENTVEREGQNTVEKERWTLFGNTPVKVMKNVGKKAGVLTLAAALVCGMSCHVNVQAAESASAANAAASLPVRGASAANAAAILPVRGASAANAAASLPVRGASAARAAASLPVRGASAARAAASLPVRGASAARAAASLPVRGASAANAAAILPAWTVSAVNVSAVDVAADGVTPDARTLTRVAISVGDGQETPNYKAGEQAALRINVMNKGNVDLRNVKITPVIEKAEDWPFEMDQLNYDRELGDLAAGEKKEAVWGGASGRSGQEGTNGAGTAQSGADGKGSGQDSAGAGSLTVRSDVTGKSYRLNFRISFDDGTKEYQVDKYVFVRTTAKESGQNNGQDGDKNGTATNGGINGNGTDGNNANGTGINGGINGSGTDGNSADGTDTNGGINGSGTDGNDANGTDMYNGGLDEQIDYGQNYNSGMTYYASGSSESGNQSIPRVIVTGFDTEPAEVKAGSNFKLVIHLKNTSSGTAVSNMLFDLQAPTSGSEAAAEAPAFLPASGSSSIYLESIPAGGASDISIELNARADLIQKPYSMTMNMKYEDKAATQYEAVSNLAIPIHQDVRFETSKIEVNPEYAQAGDEVNLTCSIYNLGRVKMYNVKAIFDGDAIDSQEQFIGNLDSGGTGYVDVILTTTAPSVEEENCRLTVSYEDEAGNVTTKEQKFTMQVEEQIDFDEMHEMIEVDQESSGSSGLVVMIAGVGVVAAAVIVAIALLRKKKKNTQLAKEEDLLDEVERLTENEHEQP